MPLDQPQPTTKTDVPKTCTIPDWRVFNNGYFKDSYYSPEMVRKIADNYTRLAEHLVPVAGLGHDREKRLSVSLGLPNVGEITACRSTPNGDLFLTVSNVPTWLGGMISARRYRSGSVELLPKMPDPSDPSITIDGPILTGLAILGDEQPAVKGVDVPTAVFDDGSPVPPNYEPMPVQTEVMASLYSSNAVNQALCFSELSLSPLSRNAMTPEQEAALVAAGFAPEQIEKMKAAVMGAEVAEAVKPEIETPGPVGMADESGEMDMMSMCKKYADDPAATPEQKMMAAMAKKFADQEKRLGAAEAKFAADIKKDEEVKMAAFSAQVDAVYQRNDNFKRIGPHAWKAKRADGLAILTTKAFSAESERTKAFSEWVESIEVQPINRAFASNVATAKDATNPGKRILTPSQARMLRPDGPLARNSPETTRKLREQSIVGA